MGAEAMGLGNSSTCLFNEWSITSNVAGLAETESLTAAAAYSLYPSFTPFDRKAITVVTPLFNGGFGASIFHFGDELYNEQIISAGYANSLGLASLGAKVNYIQYQAENFGTRGVFTVSLGGIAKITPRFFVGSFISNVNQPNIGGDGSVESIPTRMYLGLAWKPAEKTFLTTEVEKDLDAELLFKGGIEYKLHKKFTARTGFNINPNAAFIGSSFHARKLKFAYAAQYHMQLGLSHQVSLSIQARKK
jgi:hypothetical protein